MKKLLYLMLFGILAFQFTSCDSVETGHVGYLEYMGGGVDTDNTYEAGYHYGFNLLYQDINDVDVQQQVHNYKFSFNDKTNMPTTIKLAVKWHNDPNNVHNQRLMGNQEKIRANLDVEIGKIAKIIVPEYTATELNISKREVANSHYVETLTPLFKQYFVVLDDVTFLDVDLPKALVEGAKNNAAQLEANKLADKKKEHAKLEADAKVETARGQMISDSLEARGKSFLAETKVLKVMEMDIRMKRAATGTSEWGSGNVFNMGGKALPMFLNQTVTK